MKILESIIPIALASCERALDATLYKTSGFIEKQRLTSGQIAPQPRFTHEPHGIERSQRSLSLDMKLATKRYR